MKTQILLASAALALLAACSSKPQNAYTLTGENSELNGKTLYLHHTLGDSVVLDSVVVENGKFVFEGVADSVPTMAVLFAGSLKDYRNPEVVRLFIEPGEMTISGLSNGDFQKATVSGTKTNDEYSGLQNRLNPLYIELRQLNEAASANRENPDVAAPLAEKMGKIRVQIDSINNAFVANNPGSFYTPEILKMSMSHMSFEELQQAYDALTPEVQATATDVKRELDALTAIQPGMPAPELEGVNHKGEPEKLSDLKGKVVLLDFWATWCGPCRASLPHVHEIYKKYHDKGLEVFCIGDNDSQVDLWKEFIVNSPDGMSEYHQILRGLKTNYNADGSFKSFDDSNDQSKKYAVHYIPSKFLVDREGNMIGRFDDGEELDVKLAEIFAE